MLTLLAAITPTVNATRTTAVTNVPVVTSSFELGAFLQQWLPLVFMGALLVIVIFIAKRSVPRTKPDQIRPDQTRRSPGRHRRRRRGQGGTAQVGAGQPGGLARQQLEVDALGQRLAARVDLEDPFAPAHVGRGDEDLAAALLANEVIEREEIVRIMRGVPQAVPERRGGGHLHVAAATPTELGRDETR